MTTALTPGCYAMQRNGKVVGPLRKVNNNVTDSKKIGDRQAASLIAKLEVRE